MRAPGLVVRGDGLTFRCAQCGSYISACAVRVLGKTCAVRFLEAYAVRVLALVVRSEVCVVRVLRLGVCGAGRKFWQAQ